MKNHTGAVMAAALGLAMFIAPAAAHEEGAVTVYRGMQTETVRLDDGNDITVVRGQPPARAIPAALSAAPKTQTAVAGGTLWLVAGDRLLGCELRRTTQVGERRIRCVERRVPAAFR